jgi:hypothetical protein
MFLLAPFPLTLAQRIQTKIDDALLVILNEAEY